MKYFKNNNEVYGYDEDQQDLIDQAIENGWEDITDSWPPMIPEPTPEEIAAAVSAARQSAYSREADPLFFKSMRGEVTQEEWIAKIDEIRARYPAGVWPN